MADREFNKAKLTKHLDDVEAEMNKKYAGKKGMNPFLWASKNIAPLRERLEKEQPSAALLDAIESVKVIEPVTATKESEVEKN